MASVGLGTGLMLSVTPTTTTQTPKPAPPSCELTEAWRYRDWVVDSLNSDLPFDQFIVHQIAGDLLPSPTGEEVYPAGLIATTFLSNGVWDRGDADKEKIVSDMADDNIDTVGKAFLGLTLGCARCHDHKFDPISTEDYYALAGIFYSSHILKELGVKGGEYTMNRVPLVPAAIVALRQQQENQLAEANQQLDEFDKRQRYLDLVAGGAVSCPRSSRARPVRAAAITADGIVSVSGALAKDSYTLKAVAPTGTDMKVVRLEALSDPNLPAHGPGRRLRRQLRGHKRRRVVQPSGKHAGPNLCQVDRSARLTSNKVTLRQPTRLTLIPKSGWAISPAAGKDHVATFEVAPDVQVPAGAVLTFTIDQQYADTQTLGRFRLSVTDALCSPSAECNPQRQGLVAQRDRTQKEMIPPIPLAMAVQEGGTPGGLFPKIQDVPIHIRGSYAKLGAVVPRRLPRFLAGDHQPPITTGQRSTRTRALDRVERQSADRTRDRQSRLAMAFRRRTGAHAQQFRQAGRSRRPIPHCSIGWRRKFVEDGWSLKKLHRRIMLSATYQASQPCSARATRPGPREPLARPILATSARGRGDSRCHAVRRGTTRSGSGGPAGDDLTILRRSLYVQTARWDRSSYRDVVRRGQSRLLGREADRQHRRSASTVPAQSRLRARQAKQLGGTSDPRGAERRTARIEHAFQLLFSRPAVAEEIEIARQIVAQAGAPESKLRLGRTLPMSCFAAMNLCIWTEPRQRVGDHPWGTNRISHAARCSARAGCGFGLLALADLLAARQAAATSTASPIAPPIPTRCARRITRRGPSG